MDSGIEVDSTFYVSLALSFLLVPVRWVLAWIAASLIHELCHLLALRLFRCDVKNIHLGISGAVISGTTQTDLSALICASAGPIGSIMLVLLSKWIPRIAICGLIQGVYNLIPFEPLDGSKILDRLLSMCFSNKKKKLITIIIRCLVFCGLVVISIILYKTYFSIIPIFIAIMVIINNRKNSLQNGN